MVKIPGDRRGRAGHPADDQRGPQHQRHADLQPRALRRGDRGLPLRPGGVPTGDLSGVASVASFFISRVDTEVDRRLEAIGSPEALALRGKAAVAQGKLAYQQFRETFTGPRWEALAARGAQVQRPLWASTSTKNPAYPDTLYVDKLIGPDTVNTLPDATIEAFADHGTLARTVDADVDEADADVGGAGRRRRRHGRRRRAARARGRGVVPEELRRAARRARRRRPPSCGTDRGRRGRPGDPSCDRGGASARPAPAARCDGCAFRPAHPPRSCRKGCRPPPGEGAGTAPAWFPLIGWRPEAPTPSRRRPDRPMTRILRRFLGSPRSRRRAAG